MLSWGRLLKRDRRNLMLPRLMDRMRPEEKKMGEKKKKTGEKERKKGRPRDKRHVKCAIFGGLNKGVNMGKHVGSRMMP